VLRIVSTLTLGEVRRRGLGGDPDRQRTAIKFGEVKRSSERAGDESANGKDRRESDHSEAARTSGYGRGEECSPRREQRILPHHPVCFYADPCRADESG